MEKQGIVVDSPLGKAQVDCSGSAIGAVRMNPELSYVGVPLLLKEVIDQASEKAWTEIKARIDYTYASLNQALDASEGEIAFSGEVKARVDKGQKLLFKPNLVGPVTIDRSTHGPGIGTALATSWPFVAALMRWFHDRLGISYHQMALGEASPAIPPSAGAYTRALGGKGVVTTEAVIEGRSKDFYGGWGFYFVRRYLADTHEPGHTDDPMRGYEESLSGTYLPPGRARALLVYDLNKIDPARSNGREVPVPHGVNFQTITLHKAIVGGDRKDAQDLRDYPGCVLINMPKLKVHDTALLTNAIKNLGIGLYPMEVNISQEPGKLRWKYAFPHKPFPGLKSGIPHSIWVTEMDEETTMPRRDGAGRCVMRKTGGLSATMADVIEAVKGQDIFMLHLVDAIEVTNYSHSTAAAKKVPEGYVFASADPVALDVLCAHYIYTTVPMAAARRIQKERHLPTDFLQKVPIPKSDGRDIVTEEGFDTSISRDRTLRYCEERGLGQQSYYVVGRDEWQGGHLASLQGHLGRVEGRVFSELLTSEMYFSVEKPLWDLQATALAYAEANDRLTGSTYKQAFLDAFDEDGDGIIDYNERGKEGRPDLVLRLDAYATHLLAAQSYFEALRGNFLVEATRLRCLNKGWNPYGIDIAKEYDASSVVAASMRMSQAPTESADLLFPHMRWGKRKWPSLQLAQHLRLCRRLYGTGFPSRFDIRALYGNALRYADLKWGEGGYTGAKAGSGAEDAIGRYHAAVAQGAAPLPFVLYVPRGYGRAGDKNIPNVEESDDPGLIFTAAFDKGREVWRHLSLSSMP